MSGASAIHSSLIIALFIFALALPGSDAASASQSSPLPSCESPSPTQLTSDLRILSDNAFAGRKPDTAGHARARDFLLRRFAAIELEPFGASFAHPFTYQNEQHGTNIIGHLKGQHHPNQYIVVTAHYDHLGRKGRHIYNGADDNASGVAALLALATYLRTSPPSHSVIFIATDAEESGLHGAHAFFASLPVSRASLVLNINLDMLGQGGTRDTLLLVHDGRHATLQNTLEKLSAQYSGEHLKIDLRNARSRLSRLSRSRREDWRDASDYAVFGKHNIPFIHIGTTTHRDYHTPDDTLENIDTRFFSAATGIARCVFIMRDTHG